MQTTDWSRATGIAVTDLPDVITRYLVAHRAQDVEAAVASHTQDAAVTDEGRTHHGRDAIRSWLTRAAGEYTYTTRLTGAARVDDEHFVAIQRLEGNFPGGTVDLNFRFTLRDDRIAELVIEP
ncbi:nuclear transport factor 2 family protein [Plantactinospora sp. KBS50]|uniref:nuclear transport factor 2 family protein n=1 Tax=Plantactinospora sp. KBS50 TaxID=2024580 RepID=UPI000BAAFC7E|nr:nuclear transport factor 2 family protein [Plantactinospora sp. KBS50]ASW56196.1 DUF4440 domain-containing protein [Plantactinospora sp. KBS50]